MSDIDRNDPLWRDIEASMWDIDGDPIEAADAVFPIVARYRADAERLQAKLAETPWEVWCKGQTVDTPIARFEHWDQAKRYAVNSYPNRHTIRNAITGEEVK